MQRPSFKNIGRLMSATVFAQLISVAIAPIVTRIYSKEAYGFLALTISISTLMGVLSTLQYNQTIILAKDDRFAKTAFALSLWISLILSAVFLLAGLILIPFFPGWFDYDPAYSLWMYLLPVMSFVASTGNTAYFWANRKEMYAVISRGRMLTSLVSSGLSVGLGFVLEGPTGLLLGFFLSTTAFSVYVWIHLVRTGMGRLPFFDWEGMRAIARSYRDFPLMNLPTQFIQQLIHQLPVLLLTLYKGPASAGLYNLCNRVLITPIQMIASATGEVFQQKAAAKYAAEGSCEPEYLKAVKGLSLLGFLPFLVLGIISPCLFGWVFGQEWIEAGYYAQVMAFMFFLRFVFGTVSYMYYIAGRLRENLVIHIYFLASTALIFYLGAGLSTRMVLFLYASNFSLVYLIWGYRSWIFSKG